MPGTLKAPGTPCIFYLSSSGIRFRFTLTLETILELVRRVSGEICDQATNDTGSQVILNGEVQGVMSAMEYFRRKREYIPVIKSAYQKLDEQFDIIVIEGAGSPAEINLKREDIVNMGMAEMVDAPVLPEILTEAVCLPRLWEPLSF